MGLFIINQPAERLGINFSTMKKAIKNKLAMYASVASVLEKYSNEWAVLPAFQLSLNTFLQQRAELQEAAQEQGTKTVGVRAVKDAKRSQALKKFYVLSSALSAFAVTNDDVELFNKARMTRSDLTRLSREDLIIVLTDLIAQGEIHLASLGQFGVDQAFIDDLNIIKSDLKQELGKIRQAIIERKRATEQLDVLCVAIDQTLTEQLDKLVDVLQDEHPAFFTDYRNARRIVDYGMRHNPERDDGGGEEPSQAPNEE